jgi:hypothetical protein
MIGFPLQGIMRDFDNDGFVDIIVTGNGHRFYRNNGDKTFTQVTGLSSVPICTRSPSVT